MHGCSWEVSVEDPEHVFVHLQVGVTELSRGGAPVRLEVGGAQVGEVAFLVGFVDRSHCYRGFRKRFGVASRVRGLARAG